MSGKISEELVRSVQHILEIEWEMFQNVNNLGGRAPCQNDKKTFEIMRISQYSSWTVEMIESYESDLVSAKQAGRNLVMEKYAYMMEYTDPAYFVANIASVLPKTDAETMDIIREIADYLVDCEKSLSASYPNLSKAGRPITCKEDSFDFTSVETYAIGELRTYSSSTLDLYLVHVRNCKVAGSNIALTVKNTMVSLYGYSSMEDAEMKLHSDPKEKAPWN